MGWLLSSALLASCTEKGSPGTADIARSPAIDERTPVPHIAPATGLDWRHESGADGRYLLPEIMGSGCALVDFDGDGDPDVLAIGGGRFDSRGVEPGETRLFRNESTHDAPFRFTDVTEASGVRLRGYGMGCAVGDYDGDGWPDLYITCVGPNALLRNRGDGSFEDVTRDANVDDDRFNASATFADIDGDGLVDLYVTGYAEFSPSASRECTRLAGQRDYCGPLSYPAISDRLFLQIGEGRFEDVSERVGLASTSYHGLGVVAADLDGAPGVEIFVANDATPNSLWTWTATGGLSDRALVAGVAVNAEGRNEAGMGIVCADLDGDGDRDLLLTHERDETHTLYRNLGGGLFEDVTVRAGLGEASRRYSGFGAVAIDLDNDGQEDLFTAHGTVRKLLQPENERDPYAQEDVFWRNERGRFTAIVAPTTGVSLATSRGAARGDIDGDGDVDVLVSARDGPLRIYSSDATRHGSWIRIRLRATSSGNLGIGSRIVLHRERVPTLTRFVATDGSYLGASEPTVHFGLGPRSAPAEPAARATPDVRVTVYWTSGRAETWEGLQVERVHELLEGSGTPADES